VPPAGQRGDTRLIQDATEEISLKFILIIAAVLTGDPANTDPSLEVLTKLFDSRAECEQAKTKSTGEGQGEIEGKKVLRIVGRCQELSPNEVQQLKDALNR
jgi:hypothetical protein